MTVSAGPTSDLVGAAEHVLASWAVSAAAGTTGPDLGPVVLAALVPDSAVAGEATRAWLRVGTRCRGVPGLFGGTSGILAGLRLVADRHPRAARAAERAAATMAATPSRWRTTALGFDDYDVVGGPAGVVLANLTGTRPVRQEWLAPAVTHLVDLTRSGFRIGALAGHPLAGWAQGGVVTGLAHGVAGPLTALSMAAPHLPDDRITEAVHGLASWLAAQRFTDALGVVSWPGRVPAPEHGGGMRRQGWCYGTPGVGWALWAAGQTLVHSGHSDGEVLCAVATEAVATLCTAYDPDHHLDHDPLAVCHGAAGVLLVADAFARHAGLPAAAALRDGLTRYLTDRLDEVTGLDAGLLTGGAGVLAALLTVAGGDRGWLPCLAMY